MVVCNSFDINMFILSRTARWCQYLTNSTYFRFSGVAKNWPWSLYLRLLLLASLLFLITMLPHCLINNTIHVGIPAFIDLKRRSLQEVVFTTRRNCSYLFTVTYCWVDATALCMLCRHILRCCLVRYRWSDREFLHICKIVKFGYGLISV